MTKEWRVNTLGEKKENIRKRCEIASNSKLNAKQNTILNVIFHPENRRILYFNTNNDVVLTAVDSNNYLKSWSAIKKMRLEEIINFQIEPWNYIADVSGSIKYDPANYLTEQDIQSYRLFNEKCYGFEFILDKTIYFYNSSFLKNIPVQNYIYSEKAKQAQLVLDGETNFTEIYYVSSWAEIRNIDLKQAAKEILFKHENTNMLLFQIDMLRVKYTRFIKEEKEIENIGNLCLEFENESKIYAAI